MTFSHSLSLLATIALLSACASQSRSVTVQEQSQCPINLHAGQQVILSLPSNPTTGYRWAVREDAASILKSLGPEVYSAAENSDLVGGAGHSTWRFQATGSGEARLLLTYAQPWDASAEPAETFDCRIRVR
ncbi:peptidase inhibitor I42 [Pseudomonas daroniae]|uniref:Peptidase inhibitor I42 n=1 Tax=Phytopseudomonas daroniae TaxID=2487519 RepID=A0A4Q9QRK2_9GAMM|nr:MULTISPECIES: protease inhibitor I42 family protein [Pseudomonas]TBU76958.1 peptidase inhibitor I42 [Pseudomonas daroniae]TBU83505.1 peptidase inhibitor I42 [Pseudomonas daroniae]TBU85144.1 peptidase inhibitor I42 [Pseudomonas sp. FRB 228]TBU93563.1 peptidase inhibitor I42 [Pseudomonas daroniae]